MSHRRVDGVGTGGIHLTENRESNARQKLPEQPKDFRRKIVSADLVFSLKGQKKDKNSTFKGSSGRGKHPKVLI